MNRHVPVLEHDAAAELPAVQRSSNLTVDRPGYLVSAVPRSYLGAVIMGIVVAALLSSLYIAVVVGPTEIIKQLNSVEHAQIAMESEKARMNHEVRIIQIQANRDVEIARANASATVARSHSIDNMWLGATLGIAGIIIFIGLIVRAIA